MPTFRPATPKDSASIRRVLDEADLHFPGESYEDFFLAEINHEVVGIARLEEYKDLFFLTSLGVLKPFQKQGVATFLLNHLLAGKNKKIYLYTIIPDFFRAFGFRPAEAIPSSLPAKEIFGCDQCLPGQCFCMVK
jgi:N-acetylglutamate synthase-like GNAT family acetyltransferase